jgi:uncharacterized protein YlxW (UPF0749 family)
VVVFALLGFLLVVLSQSVTTVRRSEQPRRARLARLIEERRARVADLDRQVRRLRADVAAERRAVERVSAQAKAEGQQRAVLADQAGASALRGRGIEVKLRDSTRRPSSSEDSGAYRIHDVDLQLVVNALFASGAEAVAVNGNRLVATSPIRAAGDTIVVGFRPLSPPYVVTAIGARSDAFARSDISRRFERWRSLFGLGFRVSEGSKLTVPAFGGRVATGVATPVAAG